MLIDSQNSVSCLKKINEYFTFYKFQSDLQLYSSGSVD